MPTQNNRPHNPAEEQSNPLLFPEEQSGSLSFDKPADKEKGRDPENDEKIVKDNPWTTRAVDDSHLLSVKDPLSRGRMDDILGGDPSLRKREKPESERMKDMSYTDRHTRFAVENILEENEEAGEQAFEDYKAEEMVDNAENNRIIKRYSKRLGVTEKILNDVERTLDILFKDIDINGANVINELKKRHVLPGRLDKLFRRVESIRIPGELPKSSDEALNEEIRKINKERAEQLDRSNGLLEKLDKILAGRHEREESERQRTEKRIAEREEMRKLASEMGEYLTERIEADRALIKISDDYKNGKKIDWDERTKLNEDMYEASLGLMLLLRKLREENPDKILKLIPALDQSVRGNFYAVLRAFFRSHNTGITADEIKEYGVRSKNMSFANELSKFAEKAPEKDREYSFHKDITRLPDKVLEKLFHPVEEEAKEVREAA